MRENGSIASDRLFELVHVCKRLRESGAEILIVSSGAVGLGKQELGLQGAQSLINKQAAAAVGQSILMEHYRKLFGAVGISCAQVLLTHHDFSSRQRYLSLQKVFQRLLELGAIPVINENDTVSSAELVEVGQSKSFGDNDRLSALVASKLACDQLVLLSNVDAVYDDNPHTNPLACRIPEIDDFTVLSTIHTAGTSDAGRGGMQSKLEAARIAAMSGVSTIIASGLIPGVMEQIFFGDEQCGTLIRSCRRMAERKHWIGLAAGSAGSLTINRGAELALLQNNASLLPVGIIGINGKFEARQTVGILSEDQQEIGRGIVNYSSAELSQQLGRHSPKEAIVRENMVLYQGAKQ